MAKEEGGTHEPHSPTTQAALTVCGKSQITARLERCAGSKLSKNENKDAKNLLTATVVICNEEHDYVHKWHDFLGNFVIVLPKDLTFKFYDVICNQV